MNRTVGVLFIVVILAGQASAGDKKVVLKPGDAAPSWSELPGIDGKKHALADLKDKDVVVVAFTCNSCPIAVLYEDRIIAFHKKYCGSAGKVALVAINVNTIPEDRLPEMKERAQKKGMAFPYLFDESQKIARDFGSRFTPEFFVFDKGCKLVYKGAMDDRNAEKMVTKTYLEGAVQAALQGETPALAETPGRGCAIRFVNKRE